MVVRQSLVERLHLIPCFWRPHLDSEFTYLTASDARPHADDGGEKYPVENFSKVAKPLPLSPSFVAYPPSYFRGLIIGELGQYWRQNSQKSNYVELAHLFFMRLKKRGHKSTDLITLFQEAAIYLTIHKITLPPENTS